MNLSPEEYVSHAKDKEIDRLRVHVDMLRHENKELREFALMMLLVCKSKGIVGGVFTTPNSNRNIKEHVIFEDLARELGVMCQ